MFEEANPSLRRLPNSNVRESDKTLGASFDHVCPIRDTSGAPRISALVQFLLY